jgi:hypothetical protein
MHSDLENKLRRTRYRSPEPDRTWINQVRKAVLGPQRPPLGGAIQSRLRTLRGPHRPWAIAIAIGIVCGSTVGAAIASSQGSGTGLPPPKICELELELRAG